MMLDNGLYNEYALAHELRKSIGEIRKMTNIEYLEWKAFFKRRNAENPS